MAEETLTPPSPSNSSSKNKLTAAGLFIFELVKVIAVALITIGLIRYFLFKPFYVKGESMEPTFMDSEYLIIDEISYRLHAPERGDVIVFHYPADTTEFFLKRVIGLPGERVKIDNNQITVYNKEHPEGFILDETYLPQGTLTTGDVDVTLGTNQFYVLGDNRPNSFDSRKFGDVDKSLIVGRVALRGWPLSRFDLFTTPTYKQ